MIVGIVDDCERDRKFLRDLCDSILLNEQCSIIEFDSGIELLNYLGDKKRIDLLFLDIEMPDIDGIYIKEKIQNLESVFRIVFVTSHTENIISAFGYKVIGFITKPATIDKVQHYTENVYKELLENVKLSFNGVEDVYLENISYFHAANNYVEMHLVGEDAPLWIYEKIKDVEEKTKELSIYRVHKSYMVNFFDVLSVENNKIIMKNKIEIPISRGKQMQIKECFYEFKKKQMRRRV